MAVIELDLRPTPSRQPRPPVRVYRPVGLLLAVVLTLALSGAAPFASTIWHQLGEVPLADTDGSFTLVGDRVITVTDDDDRGTVTSWRADPLRQLWTTTVPFGRRDDRAVGTGIRPLPAGDVLLIRTPDYRTVALDAATGRTRWELPHQVESLDGGFGLSTETKFRPGAEYDRSSGDPGLLYLGEDGRPYREPPLRTDLRGVDLATGRTLWTHPVPGSVYTTMAGPAVLVAASDRLQSLNPQNGHLIAERATEDLSGAEVVGDVVVVQQGDGAAGYDVWSLDPIWKVAHSSKVGDDLTAGRCDDVICRRGPTDVEVADPTTGQTRWRAGNEVSLRLAGAVVLETDNITQRPLRLLDAATGAVRADLGSWQMVTPIGPIVLSRVEPGGDDVTFAAVRQADGVVQPLARLRTTIAECRATNTIVACRHRDRLDLFAYRA